MTRCLVSLGSNQGDSDARLDAAERGLRRLAEDGSYRSSQRFITPPIGGPGGQSAYRNAAAVFRTRCSTMELLDALQRLETQGDRVRARRWDARSLDLDLLLYGDEAIQTPRLRVPHPRMTFRRFVLEPACQIAGEWIHPEGGGSLHALWRRLREGDNFLTLVGEGAGFELVRSVYESLDEPAFQLAEGGGAERRPKLTLIAGDGAEVGWPDGPRLALADCPREHWREEILAALECVWPLKPA